MADLECSKTTTPERLYNTDEEFSAEFLSEYDRIIEKLLVRLKNLKKTFDVRDYILSSEWDILRKVIKRGYDIGISQRGYVYFDYAKYIASSKFSKWLVTQRGKKDKSISGEGSTNSMLKVIVNSLNKFLPQTDEKLVILDAGAGDCGLWFKFFSENPEWIGKIKLVAVDIVMHVIYANPLSKMRNLEKLLQENLILLEGDSADAGFLSEKITEHKPDFIFARTLVQHMTLPDIRTFLRVVSISGAKFISTDFSKSTHSLMAIMPFGCIYRNLTELFESAEISNFRIAGTLKDSQSYMTVFDFEDLKK